LGDLCAAVDTPSSPAPTAAARTGPASLIPCRLRGLDPHTYLADALANIVNRHPNAAVDDLLSWSDVSPKPLEAET
jgi:hypothetical protein